MQAVARFSSKRVTGIFKEALKPNLVVQHKSYATSAKDKTLKARKVQKRIPKQERRAAIVSFVEKYRAANEGKFPPVSLVNQKVGGSYYTSREIVQELEYKYKLGQACPSNLAPPLDLKESSSAASSESLEEKSTSTVAAAKKVTTKKGPRSVIFEVEGGKKAVFPHQAADVIGEEQNQDMLSKKIEVPVETSSHTITNMEKQPSLKVEVIKDANEVETRSKKQDVSKPEENHRKQNSNEHDQSSTTEGGIWGNLKSFSDKIVNFWKKF